MQYLRISTLLSFVLACALFAAVEAHKNLRPDEVCVWALFGNVVASIVKFDIGILLHDRGIFGRLSVPNYLEVQYA